jgi:penicillin-insensitive murein endopeptidase
MKFSILNPAQTSVDPTRFKDEQVQLLELVSGRPEVERIFVNPLIKRDLCKRTRAADWLRKVRPWWGHYYHFHVRLACPPNQPECRPQEPPPESAGCDAQLDWWFSAEAREQARKNAAASRTTISPAQRLAAKLARVPSNCEAVLHPHRM